MPAPRCLTCGQPVPQGRPCAFCATRARRNPFAHLTRVALAIPDPHNPLTHPLTDEDVTEIVSRALSQLPGSSFLTGQAPGSTLTLHAPLASATLGVPAKPDFCPQCGISLFDNPDTRIISIPTDPRDDLQVQCDCGRFSRIPKFLFL
jgi:hypothetical protein